MRYGSVCSGIEAAAVAWNPLGWQQVFSSDIEPFPNAVRAHHHPNVPNFGDMTKFKEWPDATIDVLVGGTPCQSFSVAGLRKGLDDPRGNLMLTYLAIADKYRPRWLVWENVPGVLSSNGGRDFGAFLGGLGQLGYGFAYRVLDAQFFNLAQRRGRVFVVGYLGDWRRAAAVLFERHSLSGNPAPSREKGENIAPVLDARAGRSGETSFHTSGGLVEGFSVSGFADYRQSLPTLRAEGGDLGGGSETLVAAPHADISPAIKARDGKGVSSDGDGDGAILVPMVSNNLTGNSGRMQVEATYLPIGFPSRLSGTQCASSENVCPAIGSLNPMGVAFNLRGREGGAMPEVDADGLANVRASSGGSSRTYVVPATQVRRLTPRECERLMGFPDFYTFIPWGNKMAADGPRYKALGNSMAVPVMAWIGRRIDAVEQITKGTECPK